MPSMPSAVPQLPTVVGGENGHVPHSNIVYDEVEQLSRIDVGPTHYNLMGMGALPDGSDCSAIINQAFTDNGAGFYVLPPPPDPATDSYIIQSQVNVGDKQVLCGRGGRNSVIKAGASFPTSTPLVTLDIYGSRIESLEINCNDVAGSTGVWTDEIHERSGVIDCVITRFLAKGLHFAGGQNFQVRHVELLASASATSATVGCQIDANVDPRGVHDVTVNGLGAGVLGAGIKINSPGCYSYSNLHFEKCTDGVLIGETAGVNGLMIHGVRGHSTVTNLIRVLDDTASKNYAFLALSKNSGTNILVDEAQSVTCTEGGLALYAVGEGTWPTLPVISTSGTINSKLVKGLPLRNFASLNFPSIPAHSTAVMTLTVTGAATGDSCSVMPNGTVEAGLVWSGWVSAANTVEVRLANVTTAAIDPAARTWMAAVWEA